MKRIRLYKFCMSAFCIVAISACTFIYKYDLLIKKGIPDIEIVGRSPGSIGESVYLYNVMIDSDSNFINKIDDYTSTATLTSGDSVFTTVIEKTGYNPQARATFRIYSLYLPEVVTKGHSHIIELRFKSGDSIDYYYKFKNED